MASEPAPADGASARQRPQAGFGTAIEWESLPRVRPVGSHARADLLPGAAIGVHAPERAAAVAAAAEEQPTAIWRPGFGHAAAQIRIPAGGRIVDMDRPAVRLA